VTNELLEKLERIESRNDLSEFISALLRDFEEHGDEWENSNLPSFLEAMSGWINDMDGYYKNHNKPFPEPPSWKTFADIVYASKVYE
jgi:hypothetical protein